MQIGVEMKCIQPVLQAIKINETIERETIKLSKENFSRCNSS